MREKARSADAERKERKVRWRRDSAGNARGQKGSVDPATRREEAEEERMGEGEGRGGG